MARPARLAACARPAFAEQRDRLLHVAVGFGERRLALHHARAGLVAELLHLGCCDLCHLSSNSVVCVSARLIGCSRVVSCSSRPQHVTAVVADDSPYMKSAGPFDRAGARNNPGLAMRRPASASASRRCGRTVRVSRAARVGSRRLFLRGPHLPRRCATRACRGRS